MVLSGFEWLVLLTLIVIVSWGISLYQQTYKPFLISTIILFLFGFMWFFTTPAEKQVVFGYSAIFVFSLLGYLGLGLGAIGILYIMRGR
jgi:hypothetical protein